MIHSVEQTSEGEMAASYRQIVAIVGDDNGQLTTRIVDAIGNQSTTAVFHLDTRYYQANVGVRQFRNGRELLEAKKQEPDLMVGIIILRNELEIMEKVIPKLDCDSHVLVADHGSPDGLNFAQSWAHSFRFELVILNPNESLKEEAKSMSEKCGVARVVELIENVGWQLKKDNFKKITGKEGLDRLLAIIEDMSESKAIWQAFSSCGIPPQTSKSMPSSSAAPQECEASISVDLNIVKNDPEPDQWFSGLLQNKVNRLSDYEDESADFNNFVQAMKSTRDANMKLTNPAQRADNAAALLSKIVDLKVSEKEAAHQKKD
ncbi:unnamed protein product [Heligmosomoides polygyrus]|uniref:Response regulatory domain-containing protein n=1 Tax=Heligmosomoides polygyrus TaxID=6339 RepID=A0A3P7YKU6_HELPZ|nr:unnamed protein product [Heligmosomoides polygyrus]